MALATTLEGSPKILAQSLARSESENGNWTDIDMGPAESQIWLEISTMTVVGFLGGGLGL